MDVQLMYTKLRRDFGRQPLFCIVPTHLLDTIEPDHAQQRRYGLRNPVNRATQACTVMSKTSINTIRVEYVSTGINHAEGGWPKDINFYDEETTTRYRRRFERDDDYVDAVLTICPKLEHLVKQNNTLDLYQHYFKNMPQQKPISKPVISLSNVYKDPLKIKYIRPVACIDWTCDDYSKMVVAYCNKKFPVLGPVNTEFACYIWDIQEANVPLQEFLPPSACWQVVCSPVAPHLVIGGLADGRVCIFDVRKDKKPVSISQMHLAHRDPVTSLLYLQSRLNNEFFSGSTDGQCLWYDIRNMSEPFDTLIMDISVQPGQEPNMANAEPVSVLQYERIFPTRFFCGTDTGLMINVNRKGKTHYDKMSGVFPAYRGPVKALLRSPIITKMLITCGDWSVHIWSEDIKTSPIVTGISQRYQINDVIWAPNKVSGYMFVGADGKLQYWDMLQKMHEPLVVMPLTERQLLKVKANREGNLVSVGDDQGSLYLLILSENLVLSGENDKQIMIDKYERETLREHVLESRLKEIKVKAKTTTKEQGTETIEIQHDTEAEVKAAEDEYKKAVIEEIKRVGIPDRPEMKKR